MANILLVEDDPDLCETMQEWLSFNQHTVQPVLNGMEALELLRQGAYDLVILDWHLPGMNGIDVLRTYKQEGGKTPIMMLTGKTGSNEVKMLEEAGAASYMHKPFDLKALASRVKELVSV
ncbi:MAG: response regulator transcription factor [Candidatus Obscuribacterales bacterium]|nr:response regulator transcription factor [Candidatus Obscuribacterales bacterium]